MNEDKVQQRLDLMKKIAKIAKIVTLVTSIVAVVLFLLFLFMPATNLYLENSNSKYGRSTGYNYYGWQLAIFGCGYPPISILALFEDSGNLAGDYIPTTHDFDTNMGLLLGLIIPLVALLVCGILAKRFKNKGKAICEFVAAGCILFGAIMLICCAPLSVLTATNDGTSQFLNSCLKPALEAGTYKTLAYPIIAFVFLLLIALFKAARGAFLLYQKAYAKSHKTVKPALEAVNSGNN